MMARTMQKSRPSTKSSGPPAPPPPPPPPEGTDASPIDRAQSIVRPSQDELVNGMGSLKKTKPNYNPVKVGRELFNSPFYTDVRDWYQDYMPLYHAKNALFSALTGGDVVTIDLYGTDQVTDLFFKVILDYNLKFPSLTKLNLSGCVHLTDQGVGWVCKIFNGLHELLLQGCVKVTEKSLYEVMTTFKGTITGMTIDMKGSSVTMIPIEQNAECKSHLKVASCPLISPTLAKHVQYSNRYNELNEHKRLDVWKMLVLNREIKTYSFGRYLVEGSVDSGQQSRQVWSDVGCKLVEGARPETRLNIIELGSYSESSEMLITEGCIVVMTCTEKELRENLEKTQQRLTEDILSIYSKHPNTVVVVCPVIQSQEQLTSEELDKLQSVTSALHSSLLSHIQTIHQKMVTSYGYLMGETDSKTSKGFLEAALHFPFQQEFSRLWQHADCLENPKLLVQCVVLDQKPVDISEWIGQAESCVPWQEFFGAEFIELAEIMRKRPSADSEVKSREYFHRFNKSFSWDRNIPLPAVWKGVGILANRGMFTQFSRTSHNPYLYDNMTMIRILEVLEDPTEVTDTKKPSVPCVGLGVLCWHEDSLVEELLPMCPHERPGNTSQAKSMIRRLEKQNILMQLPCKRDTAEQESFVYLRYSHLPEEPILPLEVFWSRKKPPSVRQVERFYVMIHGMPKSFMCAIIRHLGKVFNFTLLWKQGVYFQTGAVDALVHLTHSDADLSPALVVAVRSADTSLDSSSDGSHQATEEYLWGVLKLCVGIVDYVLIKMNLFAKVLVGCKDCDPQQDTFTMLNSLGGGLLPITTAVLGVPGRYIRCNGTCSKDGHGKKRFTSEEIHGPEAVHKKVLTPRHQQQFVDRVVDSGTFLAYTKCFLCDRCSDKGLRCEGSGFNGQTSRHCSCSTKKTLCPQCGICSRCTAFISKMETTIMPGLSSAKPFDFVRNNENGASVNILKGNCINCNTSNVILSSQPMSPEHFNYVDLTVSRGNDIVFGLAREMTQGNLKEPLNCCEVYYMLNKGTLKLSIVNKKATKWIAKEGSRVAFCMRHPRQQSNPQSIDWDGGELAIDILLDGQCIHTTYVVDRSDDKVKPQALFPVVIVNTPASFFLNAPGIWSERKKQTQLSLYPKQLVEYSFGPEKKACRLAYVSSIKLDKQQGTVTLKNLFNRSDDLTSVLYSGNTDALCIHPLGFHATKGYELEVAMPVYKGTTKEIQSYRIVSLKMGEPELEKLLENYTPADYNTFTMNQSCGVIPHKSLVKYRLETDCSGLLTYPSELYCGLAQLRDEINRLLFKQGDVSLSGGSAVTLPRHIPAITEGLDIDQMICSQRVLQGQNRMHALCHARASASETLVMPPKYELDATSEPYWQVHFLNTPGIAASEHKHSQNLNFLWAVYMSLLSQIDLPDVYSEMFEQDLTLLPKNSVCEWIQKNLLLQVHLYLGSLTEKPTKTLPYITDISVLEEAVEQTTLAVEASHIVTSKALVKVVPTFVENHSQYLLMCPAHANSTLRDKSEVPQPVFPLNLFSNYSYFIRCLEVSQCQIQKLPSEFFDHFPSLVHLDLSNNQLTRILPDISKCKKLLYLTLSDNKLGDLPTELASLTALKRLDISSNPIKVLPSVITELTNMAKLYAMDLLLEKLPSNIGDLQKLEVFSFNGNCLHSLPSSFKKLKYAERVSLNGVPWVEVTGTEISLSDYRHHTETFSKHNFPQWFSDHGVELSELLEEGYIASEVNAKLYRLFPRLGSNPKLQDDQVTYESRFPRVLLYLTNLQYLSLQYQGIVTIPPEIDRLTKLKHLVLSHCPLLEALPAELGSLTDIERLVITECPSLKTPPKEIQTRGPQAVMAYLRRLQTGSVNCRRTKLMMVGLGGAGKTCLVKALMSPEMKADLVSGEEITDGIDISSWTVGENTDSVTFNVWDFAGQTVYYNTHQFFLSNRAIYMLLWNMRLGYEHAGLDFWLNSITVHAPKAPVFVVGTHVDQVSKWELPVEKMKEQYPCIEGFIFVSSYSGQGVSEARDMLHKCALQQPYMGESIPDVWLNFEKAVVHKRETESVVTYEEVEKMATDTGIFDKSEISESVQFLHELGTLQHFNNEYLKDKVVVDPQWIVDVMACVVSVKDSPIKFGKLYHSDVGLVWADYPESLHQWLLRLTEEYDLTFPLPDKPINLTHDVIEWPEVKPGQGIKETKMLYKFVYLPAGLFNRAQVRLYQYSDSSRLWKTGSVLMKNGNLGLVTQTRNSELLVRVQGPRPENILFLVHEVFEGLISESFQGVSYDYQLPCPDCLVINGKDVYLFSASDIKRATDLKVPFLQCTRHFHTVTLTDLHSIMPPDTHTEYDFHLATAVRGLTDLRKDLKTDIFISYSQDDLTENQKVKVVDPRDVYKDLVSKGFKCYFPEPGTQVSIEQQALALRDCKVFMALVSDSYVVDARCVNLFLYARMTMKKALLMVVLGQGTHWRTSKLGILLAGEVFVNMTQPERYDHKVEELLHMASEKTSDQLTTQEYPPCFISYSWSNSQRAVEKGSRKVEGAVGYGDPRGIKDYFEEHQIKTWIDVEQVGRVGLFEDIAEGLQHARVVVACVSDQYANSSNCTMEFRFATNVLKIPTVLAVVGTGNQWRKSEVGMLSLQGPLPEVNFQDKNESAHEKLLQLVQEQMPTSPSQQSGVQQQQQQQPTSGDKEQGSEELKSRSFQELFELAQRKFLRQVSRFSEDSVLYPRLIVVDFLEMLRQDLEEEMQTEDKGQSPSPRTRKGLQRRGTSVGKHHAEPPFKHRDIGFKILCEHEQGWHSYADPISAPSDFDEAQLGRFSPYLTRILSLLKHSNQLLLNCVAGEEGHTFIKWMEELPQSSQTDFGEVYKEFREEVIRADTDMHMGQLARCHLPSGKTIWLCPEHQAVTRMTLLTNDIVLPGERHTLTSRDEVMVGTLHSVLGSGYLAGFGTMDTEEESLSDEDTDVEIPAVSDKKSEVNMAELEGILEHTKQLQAKPRQQQQQEQQQQPQQQQLKQRQQQLQQRIAPVPPPEVSLGKSEIEEFKAEINANTASATNTNTPGLFGSSMSTSTDNKDKQSGFSFDAGAVPSETAASLFQPTSTAGNNTKNNLGSASEPFATGFGNGNTAGGFKFGTTTSAFGQGGTGFETGNTASESSNTGFNVNSRRAIFGKVAPNSDNSKTTGGFSFGTTTAFGQGGTGFGTYNAGNTAVTIDPDVPSLRTSAFGPVWQGGNTSNTGLLGQSNTSNTGLFGQNNTSNTGLFGQSNTSNTGLYGQGNTNSFGQGNTSNTGLFGQSNTSSFGQGNTSNTGLFGQNNTSNTGLFGQSNTSNTGLYGQGNTNSFGQGNTSNTGLFGQSNTSSFGQGNTSNTGLFGQNNTSNTGLFGQSNTSNTGLYGQGNTNSFGQGNTSNTGLFGQSNTSSFGQGNTSNTGLFGQNNTSNTGLFGQSNTSNTGLYGQGNTNSFGQGNTSNTGLFGQSNTSSFGQGNTSNTGLFGQSTTHSGFNPAAPSQSQHAPHPPPVDTAVPDSASSSQNRKARVRERSKLNLERERTKDEIRAITKATMKAAQADHPQSETCTIL